MDESLLTESIFYEYEYIFLPIFTQLPVILYNLLLKPNITNFKP